MKKLTKKAKRVVNEAMDDKMDRAAKIAEASKQDEALDKARGLPPDPPAFHKGGKVGCYATGGLVVKNTAGGAKDYKK